MRAPAPSSSSTGSRSETPLVGTSLAGLDLFEHPVGEPFAGEEQRPDADPDRRLDRLEADPVGEARARSRPRTGRARPRSPPGRARRCRARTGTTEMTFTSSSTSPAAASGWWISNAFIAAQTASSWQSQPRHLEARPRSPPASGARMIASPRRASMRSRRTRPSPSSASACCRRAPTSANAKAASPIPSTTASVISAQCGTFAAKQHPDHERDRREEVEHPVGEHRPDQRRPQALAARKPADEHGDPAELTDASRAGRRWRTGRRRTPRRRAESPGAAAGSPAG